MSTEAAEPVDAVLERFLSSQTPALVDFRRDMHANPELARVEFRATGRLVEALTAAGLTPRVLPGGTGLWCDVGQGDGAVALRADIDALPLDDRKEAAAYRSRIPGVCHACGHDVHTTVLLGAGLVLAQLDRDGLLPGRVRLIFEPAEEANPGGANDVVDAGGLDGVSRIFALHCDPRLDVGQVGLRTGALTGSSDHVRVWVTGPGGHTARPHLTGDVTYALAKVITDAPAMLSRRVDPRSGLSLVWGHVETGQAANVIPQAGFAEGTLRTLDAHAWEHAPDIVTECISAIAQPYGVEVQTQYVRGVPPVVNDAVCVEMMRTAVAPLTDVDVTEVEQSLGGEDFAWFLERVPGALARLGVRTPGSSTVTDLHQGEFDADERALPIGVRLLTATAAVALGEQHKLRAGAQAG